MSANRFGNQFCWTTFGESHGAAMGVVIDGCPSQVPWDESLVIHNLTRRRPGGSSGLVSDRQEADQPVLLSGVFEGKTLGTPLAIYVKNQGARPQDYEKIKDNPRVGHADDVWQGKFGHRDYRGGGRASARETVSRVMAGSVAQMIGNQLYPSLKVYSYVSSIGAWELSEEDRQQMDFLKIDGNPLRFPSQQWKNVESEIRMAKTQGQSWGGTIECCIVNPPQFLGQPVFKKLKSEIAQAVLSIGACCGVEIGGGFESTKLPGSEFHRIQDSRVYGGLRGGISTGENIILKLAFKPTSTLGKVALNGRHDPCILPRAVPVVDAMVWTVLADQILWRRLDRI